VVSVNPVLDMGGIFLHDPNILGLKAAYNFHRAAGIGSNGAKNSLKHEDLVNLLKVVMASH
jgi:hypothetical protein